MTDEIREIGDDDLGSTIALLQEGFPDTTGDYWSTAMRNLGSRRRPEGTEKYGYLLTVDGSARGVILTIPSTHRDGAETRTFINISSWYVQRPYRGARALALYAHACQRSDVTYTNLSAAPHTVPAITRCGFVEWTGGQMAAVALRDRRATSPRAKLIGLERAVAEGLPDDDVALLADHEKLGCLSACLWTPDGMEPLIFLKRRLKRVLPCVQLVLCRKGTILADFGLEITSGLWRRGYVMMIIDCSKPLPGLQGRYVPAKRRRYYRGERPRQFVDHSYSELAFLPGVT